jgi:hypothetical protein
MRQRSRIEAATQRALQAEGIDPSRYIELARLIERRIPVTRDNGWPEAFVRAAERVQHGDVSEVRAPVSGTAPKKEGAEA